jgi:hypothetical protein
MTVKDLFKLSENYNGFLKNTLMLKGNGPVDPVDGKVEYFDVSTEMKTGDCYSVYDIPNNLLMPVSEEEIKQVDEFFKKEGGSGFTN